jgi:hypothetical protein
MNERLAHTPRHVYRRALSSSWCSTFPGGGVVLDQKSPGVQGFWGLQLDSRFRGK